MDFRRPLSVVAPTLDGDVLTVLAGAEEEFTGRRIHQVLGRGSEQGVRKAADRLVEQGIVSRRQAGQAKLYSLNRSHLAAPYIEGLGSLRARLIERLTELVESWEEPAAAGFLFGSVARGEADATSDLDLFVLRGPAVAESDPPWQEQLAELEREATAWTGNETRVLEFSGEDFADSEVQKIGRRILREGVPIVGTRAQIRKLLREDEGRD
jgi:predicted nucleotidyltransferase